MRHGASLLASLEGISRPVLRIATELTNNSRSGLTVRFLAKKLEMSEEEIEYLLDMNHRLLFTDLTKVKIVSEGHNAIRRIHDGLENLGDIPSFIRRMKALSPHDFRRIEELVDSPVPLTKKSGAELLLELAYKHPDSIVTFVASRGFSQTAREVFDIVWNSKEGLMPVSKIRAAHGGSEYAVEQAMWELSAALRSSRCFASTRKSASCASRACSRRRGNGARRTSACLARFPSCAPSSRRSTTCRRAAPACQTSFAAWSPPLRRTRRACAVMVSSFVKIASASRTSARGGRSLAQYLPLGGGGRGLDRAR
jgi:hypothetical protein